MRKEKCPICGAKLGKVLLTIKNPDRFESFAGIASAGYKRKWVECAGCCAAIDVRNYKNDKLKVLETAYYEVDFKKSSIAEKYKKIMALPPEKSDNAQRVIRMHDFMNSWLKQAAGAVSKRFKVVDIGAGTGVFLARFLETGADSEWDGTAVESDPLACKHLRSLNKFEVKEGIFPGKFKLKDFDLCALNKVVEHVEKPVPFLKKIKTVLNSQNGILYIEVPDKLTIKYRPPEDNILGALHHHLYDPSSLIYLLNLAGFVPLQIMRYVEPSGKISVAAFATLGSSMRFIVAK